MGIRHGRATVIGSPYKQSAESQTRSKSLSGTAWRLFAIVLLILLPELPQAAAHAVLLEHFPGENETLATSPGEVWLRFDEPVTPVLVHVLNSEGRPVVGPDAISSRDTTVRIHLPSDLKAGSYVVSYRVRSADSHPVGGSFVFAVGERADAGLGKRFDRTPASATWLVLAVALRAVFYAASLIGIGAALFRLLVDPRRGDGHLILTACLAAVASLIALLGVEGGMSAGAPLTGILDPAIWRIGSRSTLGLSVLITVLGLGLVAFSPYTSSRRLASGWIITGAVVAISGFAVTGHVATAAPRWLTGPALAVHVLCAAFWIGALLPLYRRLGDEPAAAAAIVMRFSQVAVAMVGILLAAGVIIACIQVQTPAALGDTTYGQRLLAKLILVASLLLLAAVNKWRLTPRLAGGDRARTRLATGDHRRAGTCRRSSRYHRYARADATAPCTGCRLTNITPMRREWRVYGRNSERRPDRRARRLTGTRRHQLFFPDAE